MAELTNPTEDKEAEALARCYRLLLRKAAERRARLAETAMADMECQQDTDKRVEQDQRKQ